MQLKTAAVKVGAWIRRRRKLLLGGIAGLAVLSIAVQLVFPYGRALPFASVAGQSVGLQERPAITLAIQNHFAKATATLKAGSAERTENLANLGARVNADAMASHAVEYPILFRLLPFSLLWYQPTLDRYQLEFDDSRLAAMSAEVAKKLSYKPVDAGLELETGKLEVTKAEDGQEVTADMIRTTLVSTSYNWDSTVVMIDGTTKKPSVSTASIEDIRQQALRVLAQEITITIDDKSQFTPDRETIASWLSLNKAADGSVTLSGDREALEAYTTTIANKTTTKPSPTVVTTVDSRETARDEGKKGLGISSHELADQLARAIDAPQQTLAVAVARKPIKPPVKYVRNYTSSHAGLQAYVKDSAAGGNINLAVRQLEGGRWSADGNADASIPSASTYKPLVMLRVFDDIRSKKLRWTSKIGDETIQQCFERMIVLSANECAEKLIDRYGVKELTEYLHNRGFSRGTGFTFSDATHATASDLARLMVGLEEGDLFQKGHRGMMLEKMGRQIYRQGIPAGTSAKVYDKVGFLWDYKHDAAIVNHPKGAYVLIVMTKGESWEKIAAITRDIEAILYGDGITSR